MFGTQITRLIAAGYTVKRAYVLEDITEITHRHRELMAFEMAQNHSDWFAEFPDRYRPRTAEIIRQGQQVTRLAAQAAVEGQAIARSALETTMADTGIDIWISPAAPGPAPAGIESTGDPAMNLPWSHTGLPTITVPAGRSTNNLPLGLQCASAFWTDENLLDWSASLYNTLND
jgi:Asp-tRNA(Asn)/Glu-tRNA(Gln) amidotransferase A subunit family amidase